MIKIELQECCYECDCSNIVKEDVESAGFDMDVMVDVYIYCRNKRICKRIEKLKEQNNEN